MKSLGFTKAVVYARYSTDLQLERSIEDQLSLCREFASKNGFEVVGEYFDRERSSATLFDRDGLIRLMQDAPKGKFNTVVVEALDRLSRDQEDLPSLFKRLNFSNVQILSVSEGVADHMLVGIRALTGALFLKDLAAKVKRGMNARAREGKVLGSVTYGYRLIPGRPGEREIDPARAAIVLRIFQEYLGGASPRSIAMRLNAEGVPPPGKMPWAAQLISGGNSPFGGKGILNNRMFLGEVSFGRSTTVLNPHTGKKVRRKGADPVTTHVPELRIISDDLWAAVEDIRKSHTKEPSKPRRLWSRHEGLLSEMVHCAACGGHMIIAQRSRGGIGRFKCSAAHFYSTCEHTKSYDSARLESAVIDAISEQLYDPRTTTAIWQRYKADLMEEQRSARSERKAIQKRLNEIEAAQLRLAAALERGSMPEDILVPRLQKLEGERASLRERERIASQEEAPADLSIEAMKAYQDHLTNLHENLQARRNDPEVRMAFRNVIRGITVKETPARAPYEFTINGRLGALFGLDLYPIGRPVSQVIAEQGVSTALACYDSAATGKAG